jgi:hypothetical protein
VGYLELLVDEYQELPEIGVKEAPVFLELPDSQDEQIEARTGRIESYLLIPVLYTEELFYRIRLDHPTKGAL